MTPEERIKELEEKLLATQGALDVLMMPHMVDAVVVSSKRERDMSEAIGWVVRDASYMAPEELSIERVRLWLSRLTTSIK